MAGNIGDCWMHNGGGKHHCDRYGRAALSPQTHSKTLRRRSSWIGEKLLWRTAKTKTRLHGWQNKILLQ
jgi:hypothetical protein